MRELPEAKLNGYQSQPETLKTKTEKRLENHHKGLISKHLHQRAL